MLIPQALTMGPSLKLQPSMRIRWLDSRSSQWDPQSLQSTHSNRRIRESTQANFSGVLPTFRVVDTVFVFVFLGEFLLRLAVEGTAFFKDLANYLDAALWQRGVSSRALLKDLFSNTIPPPQTKRKKQNKEKKTKTK